MQMIFIISESRADGVVKPEEADDVLKHFEAVQRNDVHQDIKGFVAEVGVFNAIIGGHCFRQDCGPDKPSLNKGRRCLEDRDASVVTSFYNVLCSDLVLLMIWIV